MFENPADLERLVDMHFLMCELEKTEPLRKMISKVVTPPKPLETRKQVEEFVKDKCILSWHPVGTCKMGEEKDSVVDPTGRVYRVSRLRVADASIMPNVVSGNTVSSFHFEITSILFYKELGLLHDWSKNRRIHQWRKMRNNQVGGEKLKKKRNGVSSETNLCFSFSIP